MSDNDMYRDGYLAALTDFETRLDNSINNDGGIEWNGKIIKTAHWDHELRDQIDQLREAAK